MEKTKKNQKTYTKKRLNSIILLLAFAAIMLIVSTYAWFSTQKNVTISNLAGTVQVAEGMEISLDGDHFKQTLDLSQVVWTDITGTTEYQLYENNTNNIPEELQPVSTVGTITAATIDTTGDTATVTATSALSDLTFYKGDYTTDAETLRNPVACQPATTDSTSKVGEIKFTADVVGTGTEQDPQYETGDNMPASYTTYPGYYAFDVFIKNTIQDGSAGTQNYGTEAKPLYGSNLQLNYDSFAKILEKVTGDGNKIQNILWENNLTAEEIAAYTNTGLQNTLRIGFAVYDKVGSATPAAGSVVAATVTDTDSKIRQIAIWEPNSVQHVEAIGDELGKTVLWDEDTATTVGSNKYNTWTSTSTGTTGVDKIYHYAMNTYGLKAAVTGATYTKNGQSNLSGLQHVYQWVGTGRDTYLGIQNTVKTTPLELHGDTEHPDTVTGWDYNELNEGVVNLYDTSVDLTNDEYATTKVPLWIKTNATSRVRVFLWMEGQDVDARNIASTGHGVQVNIDLTTAETAGTHGT